MHKNRPIDSADASNPRRLEARTLLPLIAFAILVLVVAAVLFTAMPAVAQERGVEINRIVLRVNDQILTLREYELRKAGQIGRIMANPSLDPEQQQELVSQAGKQLVKNAYEEMLVLSRAKQLSVVVDDAEIDEMVQQVRQSQGMASEEDFRQALASAGLTLEELRQTYHRDLIIRAVMGREVHSRVEVSEEEMRVYFRNHADEFRVAERRRLEEVIVRDDSGLDEAQRGDVARQILEAVRGGTAFTDAIASFRDQELTTGVIDLGWLESNELGGGLRDSAFGLEPGAYSEPVAGRGGLHVIRLVDRQESRLRPFSEVQPEIAGILQGERFGRELRTYMAELSDRAFVEENLPPEAVGYRALADDLSGEPDELDVLRAPTIDLDDETDDSAG